MTEKVPDDPLIEGIPDFGSFYRTEYRQVLGLAYLLCRERSMAEDLAQDAFTTAFRDWGSVGKMDRPDAWVRRVLVNRSASKARRLAVEARALGWLSHRDVDVPRVSASSIEVWDAIRRLPHRQREVIILVYYSGLSHAEAATVMECTLDTARTHLKRAKTRLARSLGEPS